MKNGPPEALAERLVSVMVSVAAGAAKAGAEAMSPAPMRPATAALRTADAIMEPPGRETTPRGSATASVPAYRVKTSFCVAGRALRAAAAPRVARIDAVGPSDQHDAGGQHDDHRDRPRKRRSAGGQAPVRSPPGGGRDQHALHD